MYSYDLYGCRKQLWECRKQFPFSKGSLTFLKRLLLLAPPFLTCTPIFQPAPHIWMKELNCPPCFSLATLHHYWLHYTTTDRLICVSLLFSHIRNFYTTSHISKNPFKLIKMCFSFHILACFLFTCKL